MVESAVSAGHVLVGRYRLEVELGRGGMGTIWRAQHLVLNAPVAVKVIDRTVVPDEETLSRFMREAQSAAALRSPHVVQILDYGIDGKVPFMAMELLEGENLAQRIKRVKRLSPAETARVLSHIGRAISRAHEAGIVHRDLKPENVFLVTNEDEEIAKVLDFGVAKVARHALSEGTRTRTGSILGTPFYMSPEQAQGNREVDSRSDLWSMGVIAFECMTGKRPFYSEGLGDLVLAICVRDIPLPSELTSVPLGFDQWWLRAVARDPEKRFQSARELSESLREALGLEPRDVLRDSRRDAPDVEILSVSANTYQDSPPSAGSTRRLPGQNEGSGVASGPAPGVAWEAKGESPADVNAQTVVAPAADVAGFTERQFGTTQKSLPGTRSNGAGLLIGVAAAALFAGLLGGVALLRSRAGDSDPNRALPSPLPAAARQPSEPKLKAKSAPVASASAQPPLLEFLPADEAADEAGGPAATNAQSGSGRPVAAPSASVGVPPKASASQPPVSQPDAGWVKPSWAIPDGEPIRQNPIDE